VNARGGSPKAVVIVASASWGGFRKPPKRAYGTDVAHWAASLHRAIDTNQVELCTTPDSGGDAERHSEIVFRSTGAGPDRRWFLAGTRSSDTAPGTAPRLWRRLTLQARRISESSRSQFAEVRYGYRIESGSSWIFSWRAEKIEARWEGNLS
jgi:hypothetical protein